MTTESLEQAIQRTGGDAIEFLRNVQYPAYDFPVKPEWSNWRDEQRAWRETCVILDQSHHMTDLFISGPDALKALSRLAVNSFANFQPGMAKQFVCANERGYFVSDGILIYLADGSFNLVSVVGMVNWVQYH